MEVPGSSTALGPSTADPSRPPGVPDAMPAIIAIVALFLVVAVLLILAVNFWPGTGSGGGAGGGEGEGMAPDRHAGIEHVRLDNLGDEEEGEEGEELVEVVDAGREGRVDA
ncbi:unnamed protein product [Lampetra fluviatilis]